MPDSRLQTPSLRIGYGFDIHAFTDNRSLILGGVEIPHSRGLAGHSDADVLLHAVTDGVLGALAWGDIGRWFPNTDETYRNADSKELFHKVWRKCREAGWSLVNCDCVVITEEPRLSGHASAICESLAQLFGAETGQISVKSKTMEHLGALGRKEGIAATAVVLLYQADCSTPSQ